MKKILQNTLGALAIAVVLMGGYFLATVKPSKEVGSAYSTKASYNLVGTSTSSPASIIATSTYGNAKVMRTNYLPNTQFDVAYTPAWDDEYLSMLVEVSNDGCTTYFPLGVKNVGTTEIDVFTEDSSGNVGIPFIIPGDKTSVSTTQYLASFQLDALAECIRVSVKDNSVTSTGSVYIRGTVSSN